MPIFLPGAGSVFRAFSYTDEATFERDVVGLAGQIFGSSSIYVDVKRRVGSDIVTVPDGYVIDTTKPEEPKLFIVENEIVGHDPFRHIGIQMLKFATSFEEAQRSIRGFLMQEIRHYRERLDRFEKARALSSSPNVDHYLDRAVYTDFKGLVIIDEATQDLYRVLEKINANISVIEVKAFISDGGDKLFLFDTLYDELEPSADVRIDVKSPEARLARRERRARSDTVVVPAREEGFQEVFLGEHQWRAIRISPAMKDRIKYVAAYRVAPIRAVTHLAKVQEIRPFRDTGKYQIIFDGAAEEIRPVKLRDGEQPPQGPFYVELSKLREATTIDVMLA